MKSDPLPHVFGIGAQKAGTTWLVRNLSLHPDIYIPARKEIHYFDRDWRYPTSNILAPDNAVERFLGFKRHNRVFRKKIRRSLKRTLRTGELAQLKWDFRYYFGAFGDDWYASLFRAGSNRVIGEITPAYSVFDEYDVGRVSHLIPHARIIFLLRNPVDRTWSQVRMQIRKKRIKDQTTLDFVRPFIESSTQTLRSDYMRTLDIGERYFPSEQLFIGYFEDIAERPEALLGQIISFLGLEYTESVRESLLRDRINPSIERGMPPEVRSYLCQKYRPDLRALSNRLGGHRTQWLRDAESTLSGSSA